MIKPSWRASFLISLLSRRSRLATSRSCTSMAQLVYFILRPCAISSWARAHSKWLLPAPGFPNRSKFSWRSRKLPSPSAFSCRPALTGKRFSSKFAIVFSRGRPDSRSSAAMRECFEQAAHQAEKETLSYEQYLLQLTERECEARRRNRIAALLRESGLPREKTMANFDLKRLPVKAGRQLKALVDGSFLDRQENLLLFGNPGAGKSHLLCALAHELIT